MTVSDKGARALGFLLLISGIVVLLGILSAQSQFPGYDASKSAISDLGAPAELAYHGTPGVLPSSNQPPRF